MNGETNRQHSTPTSNHWVLPTAASFGWTRIAAAADPLRYADQMKSRTFAILILFSALNLAGAAPLETKDWKTFVSESPCCAARPTESSPLPAVEFKYPEDWDLGGSVFTSKSLAGAKVGEILPGLYRVENKGASCINHGSPSRSFPTPKALFTKALKFGRLRGNKEISYVSPEGPPGPRKCTSGWYANIYCISNGEFAYQFIFYECGLRAEEALFNAVASTFKFRKAKEIPK